MLADYPTLGARCFDVRLWHAARTRPRRTLAVFEVPGAITTRGYECVDPARRRLLGNLTYNVRVIQRNARPGAAPGRFEYYPERPIDVAGRAVVIGGVHEPNYYHALLNWFIRFALIEAVAPEVRGDPRLRYLIDRRGRDEPFRSILEALGLPFDRVIWADEARDYRIERAIVPSFLNESEICGELSGILAGMIRRRLGIDEPRQGRRRLWISREHHEPGRRRILNFAEIAPILERHGFEIVVPDRMAFADQVRLFGDAAIIAGAHGAGFANCIFSAAGTRLVVIETNFSQFVGLSRWFVALGESLGLTSEVVPARSVRDMDIDYDVFLNAHSADAVADVAAFNAAIERALAASIR